MFELLTEIAIIAIDITVINSVDIVVEVIKLPCQLIS